MNIFQYPRCWIVSSDCVFAPVCRTDVAFQYPRCWIVSSDVKAATSTSAHVAAFSILAVGSFPQTISRTASRSIYPLSVSSLLDRFLRLVRFDPEVLIELLSVSSLLDRFLRLPATSRASMTWRLSVFSLLDRFLRHPWRRPAWRLPALSVSSLLDRFLRP